MATKPWSDALAHMPPSKMGKTSSSNSSNGKPIKVIECITKWDLAIFAGAASPPKTHWHEQRPIFVPILYKFRVNTLVLSALSPVFNKMLNGPFYDSRASEITFTEDDPQALMILFAVTHHKSDFLPKDIPMTVLHQLAVLADKYDVVRVLKQTVERYLEGEVRLCCVKTALFATWTFGLVRQFAVS
jgi:hypothetical protein